MKAVVLGTGLIGASVGAGLRNVGWHVSGWDPSPEILAAAAGVGAVDEALGAAEVDGADLVVLAAPVTAIVETLRSLDTDALVTDVAGVKTSVVEAGRHLPHFVGSHPMAGRESSGPGAASPAMFRGASWILATDHASADDLDRLSEIVGSLGAVPVRMTAADHDAAVAAVSHVPQVVASALVNLVGGDPSALSLAAGGFRDLTRIALSEPTWWTDVLSENSRDVVALVRRLGASLEQWATDIEAGDRETVGESLHAARTTRRSLAPPVAAVRVLLEDSPGEIARVGKALADTSTDVRDLQLRHATRGGGGVLTLSVHPGQEQALAAALEDEGFRLVE